MSEDLLKRREDVLTQYPEKRFLADRIIELEALLAASDETVDNLRLTDHERQKCHFPEHRHFKYGHVTHMKRLGEMNGSTLYQCEVCQSVHSYVEPALA